VAVHDQGIDNQVFKPVIVSLYNQVFKPAKAVAMRSREVALRGHVVIVSINSGGVHLCICQKADRVVVPVHLQHLGRVVLDRESLVVMVDCDVVAHASLLALGSLLLLNRRTARHSLHLGLSLLALKLSRRLLLLGLVL
jgi:hypothetical protein